MDDIPRNDSGTTPTPTAARTAPKKKRGRGVLWGLLGMIIAFSAGFLWQYLEASAVRAELAETEQTLVEERLRVRLGQAAISAQSGDFELARQEMSSFFDHAQDNAGRLTAEVRGVTNDFLAMRDEVITGLSRSNPEYAGVLYGMLETLGHAIDGPPDMGIGEPVPAGAGSPDTGS